MNIKKTLKEVCKNNRICGNSSIGRVLAFQAGSCGFEPRLPLKNYNKEHSSSRLGRYPFTVETADRTRYALQVC